MPLVSVIIPAYNCALYIRETIESILAQEESNDIEIIVVNDGSTDSTAEIAREFREPVRVIDQVNAGVCAARNRGIAEAKGEFIAFVDHDDYWLPSKLKNQLAVFESNQNIDVVFSNFIRWHPDGIDDAYKNPSTFELQGRPNGTDPRFSGWIYHEMLLDSWVLTSTALVRTKVVRELGGFDESLPFSEDWDFWLRVSRVSQFICLREASTLYRQHPNQGSRVTRAIDYRTRLLENASQQWGLCSKDGRCITPEQFNRQLARYCAGFGLGHLKGGVGASRIIAAKSFLKAWFIDWHYWRSLAYLGGMAIGWRPKW